MALFCIYICYHVSELSLFMSMRCHAFEVCMSLHLSLVGYLLAVNHLKRESGA